MALSSAAVWLLLWRRARAPYMLLLLAGWLGLCLYWSMLAISSGPAPVVDRTIVAQGMEQGFQKFFFDAMEGRIRMGTV
jgi:hypothetical protein